jgi:hypothetical protein
LIWFPSDRIERAIARWGQLIEASAGEIMASQIESPVLSELRPFHGKPMVGSIAKRLCHQERA